MRRRLAEIDVAAILITDAKAEYIWRAHRVERADVWSAFSNRPRYFVDDRGRYAMVGPTSTGRFLLVAIVPDEDEAGLWRLITAHWLGSRAGRQIYGED